MKRTQEILYIILQIIMGVIVIFSFIMLLAKNDIKENYAYICAQAIGFILCSMVPTLLENLFRIKFPSIILLIYLLYLTMHFFFGEILGFYIIVKHYDSFLHLSSSVMLSMFAYCIMISFSNFNIENKVLIFLVCFCFSLSCEYIWELIEFAADDVFKSNMQRYMNDQTLSLYEGHYAIKDTAKDMFLNLLGALITSICLLKKRIKNMDNYKITRE